MPERQMIVDHVLFVLEDYESKYNKDKGHIPQTVVIKVPNPNDGLHSRRRSVTAVALDGRVDATLDEMDAAAWTAIGLLAATSLGVAVLSRFSHRRARRTDRFRRGRVDAMSGRFDALAARFDARSGRVDSIGDALTARIDTMGDARNAGTDALGARLDGRFDGPESRFDTLESRLETHLGRHAG